MNPRRARAVRSLSPAMASVACLLFATGCGPKEAKLVPVEGVVLIGGSPAANIAVQFLPDDVPGELRPTSFATTDADGRFRLLAPGGKEGAVVGGHAVILADCDEERPTQGESMRRPPRLHGKYTTLAGKLRADVVEGGPPVMIDVPAGR
jgi:hypothetical protein